MISTSDFPDFIAVQSSDTTASIFVTYPHPDLTNNSHKVWIFDLATDPHQVFGLVKCVTRTELQNKFQDGKYHTFCVQTSLIASSNVRYSGKCIVSDSGGSEIPILEFSDPTKSLYTDYLTCKGSSMYSIRIGTNGTVSSNPLNTRPLQLPVPAGDMHRLIPYLHHTSLDSDIDMALRLSLEQYDIESERRPLVAPSQVQMPEVRGASLPQSLPQSVVQTIPQRVLNAFIESAIAKNESCPITMMPIEKGDAIVTPCYHILSKDAGERWISMKNQCPTCKQSCTSNETHKWISV
jgi:hypothetical protein